MRRWRALAPGAEPGPLLGFLAWWGLVQELEERATLAAMVDAPDDKGGGVAAGVVGGWR